MHMTRCFFSIITCAFVFHAALFSKQSVDDLFEEMLHDMKRMNDLHHALIERVESEIKHSEKNESEHQKRHVEVKIEETATDAVFKIEAAIADGVDIDVAASKDSVVAKIPSLDAHITLAIKHGYYTLQIVSKNESKQESKDGVALFSSSSSSVQRGDVPANLDLASAQASYKNGIFTLSFSKKGVRKISVTRD